MKEIVGKPFWSSFKMVATGNIKKRLYALEVCDQVTADIKSVMKAESGCDNRHIVDDGLSQTLTKDEIEELRYVKGTGSKEILEQLIENSKTFSSKTEFSQEKYLKKKEKKYFEYIQIRSPTVRFLAEIFYRQEPEKVMFLRKDTLSQILNYANVQSFGTYLLYDSGSNGLMTAAFMNAIGRNTTGQLIHMHPGNFAQKQGLAALNLQEEHVDRCINVNIYSVLRQYHQAVTTSNVFEEPPNKKFKVEEKLNIQVSETKPKWYYENEKACKLLESKVDALIIASKEHPKTLLKNLLCFVKPSRPIVIFNPLQEILAELYVDLKAENKVTCIKLTSNFMRNYQVLQNRTHPEVMMAGNSGFLLCGTLLE